MVPICAETRENREFVKFGLLALGKIEKLLKFRLLALPPLIENVVPISSEIARICIYPLILKKEGGIDISCTLVQISAIFSQMRDTTRDDFSPKLSPQIPFSDPNQDFSLFSVDV